MNWSPGQTLEAVEKAVIEEAFRFYKGNKTQTALSLGIAIRTLDAKLEKYESDSRQHKLREERAKAERDDFLRRQRGQAPNGLPSTSSGSSLESIVEVASQPPMPVPKRKKV